MYKIKIEQFEGPLNLLLKLIEKEDLDINKISLVKIADEYIEYVNKKYDISLEELSDFLLISSKLFYIKSKSLLPYLDWDNEEEDTAQLEEQLKIYKEFLNASNTIDKLIKEKRYFFARERATIPKVFYPPLKLKADIMKKVYREILQRIEPLIKSAKEIKDKILSIKHKIEDLRLHISRCIKIGFKDFICKAKDKTEVVVSFLALLELIKQKIVDVSQKNLFEDIRISKKKYK